MFIPKCVTIIKKKKKKGLCGGLIHVPQDHLESMHALITDMRLEIQTSLTKKKIPLTRFHLQHIIKAQKDKRYISNTTESGPVWAFGSQQSATAGLEWIFMDPCHMALMGPFLISDFPCERNAEIWPTPSRSIAGVVCERLNALPENKSARKRDCVLDGSVGLSSLRLSESTATRRASDPVPFSR